MKVAILATLLSLLALTATVNSAALSNDQTTNALDFGTALKMFYMAFRNVMPCGYAPANIPVLAPFTMDYYSFNFGDEYYSFKGNVSDLEVTGMNNYRFLGATFNTTTNRSTYDMIFPEVQLLGEYAFNAWAMLAGFPASAAGQGLLNLKLVDFRLVGDFLLAPNPSDPSGLLMSDFNLRFYIGDFVDNNWNTLWDIAGNNFINRMTRDSILMWAQQIQVEVDSFYDQAVLPIINGALENVSMTELVNFLVQTADTFNNADCTL